jgi:hypothetical protein
LKLLACAAALVLCTSCDEAPLSASDQSIQHMFLRNQDRLERLVRMAQQDHVEVLWMTTHESQPSDNPLQEDRWQLYDGLVTNTGVRSLHKTDGRIEMSLGFDSDSFMHEGAVKGLVFSAQPLSPTLESLDSGIAPELVRTGVHIAYKQLAPEWYLFLRQE